MGAVEVERPRAGGSAVSADVMRGRVFPTLTYR